MIKIIFLIVLAGVIFCASISAPMFLAQNTFLKSFITHEILALISVILTVTLASVANIYLSINKVISTKFAANDQAKAAAARVKKEIKEDCYYIATGFCATAMLLLAKGAIDERNLFWLSLINGASMWVLVFCLLCMIDVYQVAFGVANMDDVDA
jgi:hypothetical protein